MNILLLNSNITPNWVKKQNTAAKTNPVDRLRKAWKYIASCGFRLKEKSKKN